MQLIFYTLLRTKTNHDCQIISVNLHAFALTKTNPDYAFLVASPEKALCDLIANSSKIILRYMKDVETYLEQDIRMDMDEFYNMDATIFEDYSFSSVVYVRHTPSSTIDRFSKIFS